MRDGKDQGRERDRETESVRERGSDLYQDFRCRLREGCDCRELLELREGEKKYRVQGRRSDPSMGERERVDRKRAGGVWVDDLR